MTLQVLKFTILKVGGGIFEDEKKIPVQRILIRMLLFCWPFCTFKMTTFNCSRWLSLVFGTTGEL